MGRGLLYGSAEKEDIQIEEKQEKSPPQGDTAQFVSMSSMQ
jgi:hypothetical protein